MTQKKKPPASTSKPTGPAPVPLSPRQVALRKLYRGLIIVGIIVAAFAFAVLGNLYGKSLLGHSGIKFASGGKDDREPRLNDNESPGAAPDGMVRIPGREFFMGVDNPDCPPFPDADNVHFVYVDGFWMDKTEVTNEQFAKFVAATGYVTEVEQTPDPKDAPALKLKDLKPFSFVFRRPPAAVNMRDARNWWEVTYGADWKHPDGPNSNIR